MGKSWSKFENIPTLSNELISQERERLSQVGTRISFSGVTGEDKVKVLRELVPKHNELDKFQEQKYKKKGLHAYLLFQSWVLSAFA